MGPPAGRAGRAGWTGLRYFRTRDALIAACRALCGACDPAAMFTLEALPAGIWTWCRMPPGGDEPEGDASSDEEAPA